MRKRVFCIWSICLLALMPLLMGCDKEDEEEDLILVESFVGTDGMEGEKIVMELEDVPAYIMQDDTIDDYVIIGYSNPDEVAERGNEAKEEYSANRIGISTQEFSEFDIPLHSKIYISASVTNVERVLNDGPSIWPMDSSLDNLRKAYLRDIRIRN